MFQKKSQGWVDASNSDRWDVGPANGETHRDPDWANGDVIGCVFEVFFGFRLLKMITQSQIRKDATVALFPFEQMLDIFAGTGGSDCFHFAGLCTLFNLFWHRWFSYSQQALAA